MDAAQVERILKESQFFKGFQQEQIARIARISRILYCQAGDVLYRQGGSGEQLYIVAEGQIVLERAVSVGPRQGTLAVAALGRGKIFGGWSTLLNEPHTLMLSAVCRKAATLVEFKGSELRQLMTTDISLGFDVLERLCFLLRDRVQAALGAIESM